MRPLIVVLVGFLALSCSKKDQSTDVVTFALRGEVMAIDTARLRIVISHEEIPDYMPAMTMPFKVKDRELLRGLSAGDSVGATLAVSRTESWLESLAPLRRGESVSTLSPDQVRLAQVLREGDEVPDVRLVNQDGREIKFSDFRGKSLAVTFIYTRCPLPDFCIRMSNQFARVQKSLKGDGILNGRWHLMSVSFDPKFDRPAVLKRYAAEYGADFSSWDFVTDGDTAGPVIRRLADGLGLEYSEDEGLIDHNLRTVLIDTEGKLVKVITGNEWKPEEVAAEIKRLAPGV
jgi:protein SCO1/2